MVLEHKLQKINVEEIKFDKTNPNEMSDEQMRALKMGMEKYGYLVPVILNENMQILDGEHRLKVYQELGQKTIPAYVIKTDKVGGKILRQVMNKLRGEHDIHLDTMEFKHIVNADQLEEFAELLAKPAQEFMDQISSEDDLMKLASAPDDEISQDDESKAIKFVFATDEDYMLVSRTLKEWNETKELALLEIINVANQHRV
tara:strand:- start:1872 stop:2474 length:603 start_codon:yes stop_codon:yes gene_type:complete